MAQCKCNGVSITLMRSASMYVVDVPGSSLHQLTHRYHQTSHISHTKSLNLNISLLILQMSLSNPLKPGVKSRMKMKLEQRQQALLQQHLSDQQFYCLLRRSLYQRFDSSAKHTWNTYTNTQINNISHRDDDSEEIIKISIIKLEMWGLVLCT